MEALLFQPVGGRQAPSWGRKLCSLGSSQRLLRRVEVRWVLWAQSSFWEWCSRLQPPQAPSHTSTTSYLTVHGTENYACVKKAEQWESPVIEVKIQLFHLLGLIKYICIWWLNFEGAAKGSLQGLEKSLHREHCNDKRKKILPWIYTECFFWDSSQYRLAPLQCTLGETRYPRKNKTEQIPVTEESEEALTVF